MIKINLLPQKRTKKRVASEGAIQPMLFGVVALAVAGIAVAMLVDRPRRARLSELTEANQQLQNEIQSKNKQLVGYAELKKAADEADERYRSIQRLLSAKVVPAHVLHELGEILTANKYPTMTEDMAKRTGSGPESDPNKRFQADWDASHVWLSGFSDIGGDFKLEGGAQSESDVTQLAKRLAASAYFLDVTPAGGERVADATTGTNYYRFTITGKVVY
ncbi:MAG TPA: PilN domain-containing protein [Kofleriaceae bacterium]